MFGCRKELLYVAAKFVRNRQPSSSKVAQTSMGEWFRNRSL